MVNKALSITEILYSGYLFLFLFDNTISYYIYIDNMFCIEEMNKKINRK